MDCSGPVGACPVGLVIEISLSLSLSLYLSLSLSHRSAIICIAPSDTIALRRYRYVRRNNGKVDLRARARASWIFGMGWGGVGRCDRVGPLLTPLFLSGYML